MNTVTSAALPVLRAAAGPTVEDVAMRVHTTPAYLAKVEMGNPPPTPQWVGNVTAVLGAALAQSGAAEGVSG